VGLEDLDKGNWLQADIVLHLTASAVPLITKGVQPKRQFARGAGDRIFMGIWPVPRDIDQDVCRHGDVLFVSSTIAE